MILKNYCIQIYITIILFNKLIIFINYFLIFLFINKYIDYYLLIHSLLDAKNLTKKKW